MFETSRRWFKRNRTGLVVGVGLLGATYLACEYVLGKITETRHRINEERISRENLRRRFRQNQEDCTYTVLALLPTATENTLRAIPVEEIIRELQSRKSDKRTRTPAGTEAATSEAPSNLEDDDRSFTSSNYVHASQIAVESGQSLGQDLPAANIYGKRSKNHLWNQLKISSLTRALTMIYALALLTLLTRIQLNLLGRRTYLSSVVSLASPSKDEAGISLENRDDDNLDQDYGDDFDTNRKYLTFSWWLLHRGWTMVMNETEAAVKEVFGSLTPREDITFEHLSRLILEVRRKVEGASDEERRTHHWLGYLLPPRDQEETVLRESGTAENSPPITPVREGEKYAVAPALRRLLDETSDLIESPTFAGVLTLLLDASFSLLIDDKVGSQAYKINSIVAIASDMSKRSIEEVTEEFDTSSDGLADSTAECQRKAKLATVLAICTRQAHAIGSGGNLNMLIGTNGAHKSTFAAPSMNSTNEYLTAMEMVGDLEAFAAVIYSSNFEVEETATDVARLRQGVGSVSGADSRESEGLLGRANRNERSAEETLETAWNAAIAQ